MSAAARILIVDDEEPNRFTFESALSLDRHELHLAANGPEACRMAREIMPDLVLLDVMMPGMDGFQVCRRLRADPVLGSVPILLVTALSDHASRLAGIEAGADDFISKPCSLEELRARVRVIARLNRFRAIAEQRGHFEQLFAVAPSALVLVSPEGRVSTANARATELFGPLDPAPLKGRSLFAGLPGGTISQIADLVARASLDEPGPPGGTQISVPAREGERIFNVRATRFEAHGDPLVLLVLNDVTAEVRAKEKLLVLNEQLDGLVRERTAQLETANELLLSYTAFVSHDLRSPLSVVRGYLSMLESHGQLPPDAAQLVQGAGVASEMMEGMVANILAMASDEHHGRVAPVAIDPRPILEKLAWKISSVLPKPRPRIVVGAVPRVYAAAPLVERVFYNLLANAAKYAAKDREALIEIGSTPTATGTAIHVRDNGIGFSPEQAEHIFGAFSRLPDAEHHEGLGLGLALVSRLIGAHQGKIWAEGRPGEGATFYVEFPTGSEALR